MRIACRQNQIQNGVAYSDFVLRVNPSFFSPYTLVLPFFGDVDCVISWGDGTYQTVQSSVPINISKTYPTIPGIFYTVTIKGKVSGLGWRTSNPPVSQAAKFNHIDRWGNVGLASISGLFRNAGYLLSFPHYIPFTITDLSQLFQSSGFSGVGFYPLETWETSNVTTLGNTFRSTIPFNRNISSWNTSKVTSMAGTFAGATGFNQNISSWDTSNVTTMNEMFLGATSFNQPVNTWDTSKVTNFVNTFRSATSFNQPVNNWNTSSATTMGSMFLQATAFNQPVSNWNVSNVSVLSSVFQSATNFNQNLGNWNLRTAGVSIAGLLTSTAVNTENYSRTLIGWSNNITANGGPYNITFTATGRTYHNVNYGGSPYSDAVAARAYLTTPVASGGAGWTITGDTLV